MHLCWFFLTFEIEEHMGPIFDKLIEDTCTFHYAKLCESNTFGKVLKYYPWMVTQLLKMGMKAYAASIDTITSR